MAPEEKEIDLLVLARNIWTQRKKIFRWGAVGLVVGLVVAVSTPREYTTQVKLALESDRNMTDASMGSLAQLAGVDLSGARRDGITTALYPDIVKSTSLLAEFIPIRVTPSKGGEMTLFEYMDDHLKSPWWSSVISSPLILKSWITSWGKESLESDPYAVNIRDLSRPQLDFIQAMAARIGCEKQKETGAMMLTVRMQDPEVAMVVNDSIVSKLQRYMTDYRTQKSRLDLENSRKMYAEARQKYYVADAEYAEAVDRAQGNLSSVAQVKIERLRNEKNMAFSIYQQAAIQVDTKQMRLDENIPVVTVISPAYKPLQPSGTGRMVITILFAVLGMIACAGVILVKEMLA